MDRHGEANGWRIGELAKATGLTVRALRYYDQVGLLRPSGRSTAGHRLYDADDVTRLYQVVALRHMGLNVADTRAALATDAQGLLGLVQSLFDRLGEEIETRRRLRAHLQQTLDAIHRLGRPTVPQMLEVIAMVSTPMMRSALPGHEPRSGKVRDIYDLPGDRLLIVATDRVSAFDVVMPTGIPRKGEVLTRISAFWFERTSAVVPNAMIAVLEADNARALGVDADASFFGRSMVMRRTEPIPVECVVRGYLAGSAWADYQREGSPTTLEVVPGLRQCEELPAPLFTPTSKAATGHDLPMTYADVEALVGVDLANVLKLRSLALYGYGASVARERGILIADTKFEFGMLDGEVTLIDEVMTPDSSRFWPADQYQPGHDQPSFDKQYLRNWLTSTGWNREPPGPELPPEVVRDTSERYIEAYRRLTGLALPDPAA
ncbi:MAG: phosphoribosylaminoimidazolesuccinocarboxamide synthase [Dehalococcoidia bacterium]|nr:phosphoribosylaminoimidazolesuccinocarboxamide synthase [Dehalococcoidia bacterium]